MVWLRCVSHCSVISKDMLSILWAMDIIFLYLHHKFANGKFSVKTTTPVQVFKVTKLIIWEIILEQK
jgi:hypothetical protein